MGRRASGSVFFRGGRWYARISLPDGTRRNVPLPLDFDEERARAKAAEMSALVRMHGVEAIAPATEAKASEKLNDYVDRWLEERKARGLTTFEDDRGRLRTHVLPLLGDRTMRTIATHDLERVRDRLDVRIRAGTLAPSTAANVWTVVSTLFRDSTRSKRRDLRVRAGLVNPMDGVEKPDGGPDKSMAFLYPSEATSLLACADVSLLWRRRYALATYLYLRLGELEALEWRDIDLTHRVVTISRAIQADGTLGSPKNGTARRVPIEAALVPLLKAMREGTNDSDRLVTAKLKWDAAGNLRRHLLKAELTRAALHERSTTHVPLRFHDLRASGITWRAVRGDSLQLIRVHAGHADIATTDRYVRVAEAAREGFGEPFPALPVSLLGVVPPIDEAPALPATVDDSGSDNGAPAATPIPEKTKPSESRGFRGRRWRPQRDSKRQDWRPYRAIRRDNGRCRNRASK